MISYYDIINDMDYDMTYDIIGWCSTRHLEPCQNQISGHDVLISVYCYIEPDIGYDIADTRYLDMSRYRDIRYQYIPDIGYTRYRVCPDIWYTRYQYRDIPISGPNVTISGH